MRNLLRLWGGWWNGNAADLLPATPAAQAGEIAALAGGVDAARRARPRAARRRRRDARRAPRRVGDARRPPTIATRRRSSATSTRALFAASDCLMARGIYRAAMNDAERALGEAPTPAGDRGMALMRNAKRYGTVLGTASG